MESPANQFVIIGGGLAGCECALALARAGIASTIYVTIRFIFRYMFLILEDLL